MEDRLQALFREIPLEPRWESPALFHDSMAVGEAKVHLVGLHTKDRGGRSLTASAAGDAESVLDRAYFELLERSAALRASELDARTPVVLRDREGDERGEVDAGCLFPSARTSRSQRHSLSNGVAAHRDWRAACRGAGLESIERDRVLRSWFLGGAPPERIDGVPDVFQGLASHDVRVHRFVDPDDPEAAVEVCGVFLLPLRHTEPFCWGSGAGHSLLEALGRAEAEALQRLGFLCGEALPDSPPLLSPTPDFHLDFFLHSPHHARIRRWLTSGMPAGCAGPATRWSPREPRFADLTPPALRGRAVIARAFDPARMPLVFGAGHPWVEQPASEARVHPIA